MTTQPLPTLTGQELPIGVIYGLNCFYTKVSAIGSFPDTSFWGHHETTWGGSRVFGRKGALRPSVLFHSLALLHLTHDLPAHCTLL